MRNSREEDCKAEMDERKVGKVLDRRESVGDGVCQDVSACVIWHMELRLIVVSMCEL